MFECKFVILSAKRVVLYRKKYQKGIVSLILFKEIQKKHDDV